MRLCRAKGCFGLVNAAGVYCDACDLLGMPENYSRTRDEAWLAYKTTDEIDAIPFGTNGPTGNTVTAEVVRTS